MNILITGAFGFVGTNLAKSIKSELTAQLIALDIFQPKNHAYDEFIFWDDLNKKKNVEFDAIIHLAGKAHDVKNTTDEAAYFEINVELTKQIFEYFIQSNTSKFIFFSSVKAVADELNGNHLDESEIPNPKTPYGKSKLAAENFLCSQELPKSKKLYILRPCMIHGPGNKGNLNLLYKQVASGIPWPLGSYDNERSFTSIDNLAFVINSLLEKDIKPGIYQIADDEVLSTNRLIELIAKSKGRKAHIWNINKKIIYSLAKLGDTIHLPINTERLKKLTDSYVVSNEKLKKALRIDKMPMQAEQGITKTISSF
ncbi:Nucleoside-diphosphate-sugar epimerase [Draconibacterium orientale]|uniref:Nucleoside-diphosphate-sugar epimerase n=1 Tax=Draconibacterium orientale TaxID=1168034 RepID=A0A1I0HQK2_9BACT|nr:NAD-dependent epimerase/dehydratase family protein [Draconibacterium orientale]SET86422.1 Nucleoside-diphosphate-sugar epimerase [Draconibacterium orientale]